MSISTVLARRTQFRCAHLYRQQEFTHQQNQENFGLCYSPHGHGHTYTLEAYFSGPIDSLTGMIINLTEVDSLLKETLSPLKDKHLNFEVEEFKSQVPTTENLAHYIYEKLEKGLAVHQTVKLNRIRLYESDDLWVDLLGDPS